MALDDQRRKLERLDAASRMSTDLLRQLLEALQGIRTYGNQTLGPPGRVGCAPAAGRRLEPPAHLRGQPRRVGDAALRLGGAASR